TGQIDPNNTALFDLPDMMHNRVGPLPQDIPHQIKLDGYYSWRVGASSQLVTGTSIRAQSGSPRNYQGAQPVDGRGQTFILPAGMAGRNSWSGELDLQVSYQRQLPHGTALQLFVGVYNLFGLQTALLRDNNYTFDSVNPIVNGMVAELNHLKA